MQCLGTRGENLIKVFDEAMVLTRKMYNTEIYAVVFDNASSMVRMGEDILLKHGILLVIVTARTCLQKTLLT